MNLDFSIILPILIAFGISVVLSPIVIPFLKKLKFGQFVRDDGPETHLKKSGTPTMGGLIILLSLVITSLFYMKDYPDILPVLFVTLGFGLIGFLDDYIKVVMKRSMGLRAWQKMLGQLHIILRNIPRSTMRSLFRLSGRQLFLISGFTSYYCSL